MANVPVSPTNPIDTPLYVDAEQRLREHIAHFSDSLLYQSKLLAFQNRDDLVLRNHVDAALDIVYKKSEPRWWSELILALGGGFLGAGLQGVLTEVFQPGHAFQVLAWIALTIVGLFMIFGAILSRRNR